MQFDEIKKIEHLYFMSSMENPLVDILCLLAEISASFSSVGIISMGNEHVNSK